MNIVIMKEPIDIIWNKYTQLKCM